jgi:hypothetical protein
MKLKFNPIGPNQMDEAGLSWRVSRAAALTCAETVDPGAALPDRAAQTNPAPLWFDDATV